MRFLSRTITPCTRTEYRRQQYNLLISNHQFSGITHITCIRFKFRSSTANVRDFSDSRDLTMNRPQPLSPKYVLLLVRSS
jgi:hypothetical protein